MSDAPQNRSIPGGSKAGRSRILLSRWAVALTLVGVFLALRLLNPLPLESLRESTIGFILDAASRLLPENTALPDVVVVDIDDPTVNSYGKWPLPRSEITRLIDAVYRARPEAIGCACVFLGESEGADADFDRRLALSFHAAKVVLGVTEQRSAARNPALAAGGKSDPSWTIDRPVVGFDNAEQIHDVPAFVNVAPVNNIFTQVAGGVGL